MHKVTIKSTFGGAMEVDIDILKRSGTITKLISDMNSGTGRIKTITLEVDQSILAHIVDWLTHYKIKELPIGYGSEKTRTFWDKEFLMISHGIYISVYSIATLIESIQVLSIITFLCRSCRYVN